MPQLLLFGRPPEWDCVLCVPVFMGGILALAGLITLDMASLMTAFPLGISFFCFLMLCPMAQHAVDPDTGGHPTLVLQQRHIGVKMELNDLI